MVLDRTVGQESSASRPPPQTCGIGGLLDALNTSPGSTEAHRLERNALPGLSGKGDSKAVVLSFAWLRDVRTDRPDRSPAVATGALPEQPPGFESTGITLV